MAKNIVICSDGTNNSFDRDLTNVARIKLIAREVPEEQFVWYDAGVGVEAAPGLITRPGRAISKWMGLAFGLGLVRNVTEAYLKLIETYENGDQVFLFGFSRGAYTVRVLAGLIENYGLLRREHTAMAPDVVRKYRTLYPKSGSPEDTDKQLRDAYIYKTHGEARVIRDNHSVSCPIHFMGIFDTVSSLGWAWEPQTFPNTTRMPHVKVIRHALAIDERRAKFRANHVAKVQDEKVKQDVQEVWFAGVHCDVGGGYPERESGLAKVALAWMLREARQAGLLIDEGRLQQYLNGPETVPDVHAVQHESLSRLWWVLEYIRLPLRRRRPDDTWSTEMIRYRGEGWRTIKPSDFAHRSLRERLSVDPPRNIRWSALQHDLTWAD